MTKKELLEIIKNNKLLLSGAINSAKIKVTVAGIGAIDKCDHCGIEFTMGVACWKIDEWKSLDLCHICLKEYYDECGLLITTKT
jgi:hypothetical protein